MEPLSADRWHVAARIPDILAYKVVVLAWSALRWLVKAERQEALVWTSQRKQGFAEAADKSRLGALLPRG